MLPLEHPPFIVHVRGRPRTYRVHDARLEVARGDTWVRAWYGVGVKAAIAYLKHSAAGTVHEPIVVQLKDQRLFRRHANGRDVEQWEPEAIIPYDWGPKKRAGYWRRIHTRGPRFREADAALRAISNGMEVGHATRDAVNVARGETRAVTEGVPAASRAVAEPAQ